MQDPLISVSAHSVKIVCKHFLYCFENKEMKRVCFGVEKSTKHVRRSVGLLGDFHKWHKKKMVFHFGGYE